MANRNAPLGFRAARHASGGVPQRCNEYFIASALASNIFRGDAVIPVITNKRINVAAAGNRIIGVFDGVTYVDSNGDSQFRPRWATGTVLKTGTVARASVYDDPATLFEIQMSAAFTLADVGAFADLTKAVAGNADNGNSGDQIDSATVGAGTVFRIEEFVDRADNEVGANAKVLVQATLHYKAGALTAI